MPDNVSAELAAQIGCTPDQKPPKISGVDFRGYDSIVINGRHFKNTDGTPGQLFIDGVLYETLSMEDEVIEFNVEALEVKKHLIL